MLLTIKGKSWHGDLIAKRVSGSNAIKHLKTDAFKCPEKLPFMFKSWEEYAMYLADKLIKEDKHREALMKKIKYYRKFLLTDYVYRLFYIRVVNTILSADYDFTKLINFCNRAEFQALKKIVRHGWENLNKDERAYFLKYDKFIKDYMK